MNPLYRVLGISKQGVHQWLNREVNRREEKMQFIGIIRQIREDHPRLSCRKMYDMINPVYMGRDQFEDYCFSQGFKIEQKRNRYKTTDSSGVKRFENQLLGIDELTGVNQVWVSDITYYQLAGQVYYLTFTTDLYSRKIVGYSASRTLKTTDTTIPALKMAIKNRGIGDNSGLIIHSDGGGQYYCKEFLTLTKGMKNSMGQTVYDNPHAERVNGIMKNDYLIHYNPVDFMDLIRKLAKAVHLYNYQRPHISLNKLCPASFEDLISKGLLTKAWTVKKQVLESKKEKVNISLTSY